MDSVGTRIRRAREDAQMTQQDVAKLLGLSRAAIAQWETGVTSPSINTVTEVAKLLDKPAQWLAFGVGSEPTVIYKPAEGTVAIGEVMFGEKPDEKIAVREWHVPADYLRGELRAGSNDGLILWRVEAANMEPTYEYGDRVIVDTSARKASPPGIFLVWDGVGPALNHVTVVPTGGKAVARVSSTDGKTASYEVPAEKLVIIGRVRGVLKSGV